jgi:group I intron endonuclease
MTFRRVDSLTAGRLRAVLDYVPATGRLVRKSNSRRVRPIREIGYLDGGHHRTEIFGHRYATARLVWLWHHGELPLGMMRHIDGDNGNDRIENLAPIRKPVRVLLPDEGVTYALPPENTSGIYAIVHIATGRKYIGSAVDVAMRWREHQNALMRNQHHSIALQRAWNKRGRDAFGFRLLLTCRPQHLLFYEQRAIDTWQPVFNCNKTAGSMLGFRFSDESKLKMAAAARRTRNRLGKPHTEESKRKISLAKTGRKMGRYSPERVRATTEALCKSIGAISADQVRTIRKMKQEGKSHGEVATIVGCSYAVVADVAQGRSFKWVT